MGGTQTTHENEETPVRLKDVLSPEHAAERDKAAESFELMAKGLRESVTYGDVSNVLNKAEAETEKLPTGIFEVIDEARASEPEEEDPKQEPYTGNEGEE